MFFFTFIAAYAAAVLFCLSEDKHMDPHRLPVGEMGGMPGYRSDVYVRSILLSHYTRISYSCFIL